MSLTNQQARGLIRKAVKRVPVGESITHLNIMPMMDMMTILLVAFIGQSTADQIPLPTGFQASDSVTQEVLPEQTTVLFVTKNEIVVGTGANQATVVPIKDGRVADPDQPPAQVKIDKLAKFLGGWRKKIEEQQVNEGKKPDPQPAIFIVADKDTPYSLLYGVLLSSRAAPANYQHFHLVTSSAAEIEVLEPPE